MNTECSGSNAVLLITGSVVWVSETRFADVAVILDSSGSIRFQDPDNWEKMKSFTICLLSSFDISESTTRASLVSFSDQARVEFYLDTHREEESVLNDVRDTEYQGLHTDIAQALRAVRTKVRSAWGSMGWGWVQWWGRWGGWELWVAW